MLMIVMLLWEWLVRDYCIMGVILCYPCFVGYCEVLNEKRWWMWMMSGSERGSQNDRNVVVLNSIAYIQRRSTVPTWIWNQLFPKGRQSKCVVIHYDCKCNYAWRKWELQFLCDVHFFVIMKWVVLRRFVGGCLELVVRVDTTKCQKQRKNITTFEPQRKIVGGQSKRKKPVRRNKIKLLNFVCNPNLKLVFGPPQGGRDLINQITLIVPTSETKTLAHQWAQICDFGVTFPSFAP